MPPIGVPELLVILALILLVFGPKKLPEIARGLGQGLKEFRHAVRDAFSTEDTVGSSRPGTASPPTGQACSDPGSAGSDQPTEQPPSPLCSP